MEGATSSDGNEEDGGDGEVEHINWDMSIDELYDVANDIIEKSS